jgi:hypothetical protein
MARFPKFNGHEGEAMKAQCGGARSLVSASILPAARPLAGARKAHKQFDVGRESMTPLLQRAPRTTEQRKCAYCHRPLDPVWDGKATCNSYACYLTRARLPTSKSPGRKP